MPKLFHDPSIKLASQRGDCIFHTFSFDLRESKGGLESEDFFFMGKVLFDLCVLCVSMIYETKELSLDELYEKVGQA